MRALEATRDIAVAIGGESGLERVLELIVKRGRALVDARAVLIMLCEGPGARGRGRDGRRGRRHAGHARSGSPARPRGRCSKAGVRSGSPTCAAAHVVAPARLGVADAHTALLVPMLHRGAASACSRPSTAATTARQFTRDRRAAACRPSRRRRRTRSRSPRAWRPTGCAARSRPPRPSAAAGRASCTTRRCRAGQPARAAGRVAAAGRPERPGGRRARGGRARREARSKTCAR